MSTNLNVQANKELTFDFVLKVVERCNLACPYCYYFFQEYDGNGKKSLMTEEVESALPEFFERSACNLNLKRLNIVLHGGEPLMMKKKRVDKLCRTLRESLTGLVEVNISIQTNGVLIDDEWIDIFERHGILVGVSIDGPPEIHDRGRPDHKGRGSYHKAVRGLKMLQEAVDVGRLDRAGLMGVIENGSGEEQLRHFVEELNVTSPNINFPRGGAATKHAVTWNAGVESHREMVRFWLNNLIYPKFYYVRGLTEVLFALKSDFGAQWNDRRCSSRHYVATISSEGELLPDDNLLGVDPDFADVGLNIFDHSLRDLVRSRQWQSLNAAIDDPPPECRECEWYRSCRSGELFNRYAPGEGYTGKSVLCETIKMIHEEVSDFLIRNKVILIEELATRLSEAPTSTSAMVFEELMSRKHT